MPRVAAIILSRNLPQVTDALSDQIRGEGSGLVDVYVVEAGSDPDQVSQNCTWHADWPEAREHGLRYARGMNYAFVNLEAESRFQDYEHYLLLTNDAEFREGPVIESMLDVMDTHSRVGVLSPCSRRWGERFLLREEPTKYFWYILNTALMLRRDFIESVMNVESPTYMDFLWDGTNFRGYGAEMELIAKAYSNDWAAAITTHAWAEENEAHLLTMADIIKTEQYEENLRLYVDEGRKWMRRKYGFNSRWLMQRYAKYTYDTFFEFHPECSKYRI